MSSKKQLSAVTAGHGKLRVRIDGHALRGHPVDEPSWCFIKIRDHHGQCSEIDMHIYVAEQLFYTLKEFLEQTAAQKELVSKGYEALALEASRSAARLASD